MASRRQFSRPIQSLGGASTRNGGQAQISSGRLKRSQWIKRWGVDVAKKMHGEVCEAFELFNDLIHSDEIDCDPQTGGHYYIAHREKVMSGLQAESDLLNATFWLQLSRHGARGTT